MSNQDPSNTQNPADHQKMLLIALQTLVADEGMTDEAIQSFLDVVKEMTGAVTVRLLPENGQSTAADEAVSTYVRQHGNIPVSAAASLPLSPLPEDVEYLFAADLKVKHQTFGVLWLGFASDPHLSAAAESLLQLAVRQIGLALAARAYVDMAERYQLLDGMVDGMMEPAMLIDGKRIIREFNTAAARLFEVQDAVGKRFEDVVQHPQLMGYINRPPEEDTTRVFVALHDRFYQPRISDAVSPDGTSLGKLIVLMDVSHYQRLNENMMLFLQTVSHDLRSPLTAAKGFVDMLPMVGGLNEKQIMMQEKVLTSIVDMTNLVEKVLDAGRLDPEMGAYQLRRDLCDPTSVVEKVVSNLTAAAHKKKLILKSEIAHNVPVMNLDELMIERALMNLVENAIKYTPEGGEVMVRVQVDQNNLRFDVEDNGLGISPDQQTTLFERGSRIRRTEHKSIRGSGLGLFIVKNVAQQHGGEAKLDSAEGAGSRFTIIIPIAGQNALGGG